MKKIIFASLFLSSLALAGEGTGDIGSGVSPILPEVDVVCTSGATKVVLYNKNADKELRIFMPTTAMQVEADGFSVYSDLANIRTENGKLIFQSYGSGGSLAAIAVQLNKGNSKAQLTRIETTGAVVKKNLTCTQNPN